MIAARTRNQPLRNGRYHNRAEAAMPSSTPGLPASAARRKIHYAGRVIKKKGERRRAPFAAANQIPSGKPLFFTIRVMTDLGSR